MGWSRCSLLGRRSNASTTCHNARSFERLGDEAIPTPRCGQTVAWKLTDGIATFGACCLLCNQMKTAARDGLEFIVQPAPLQM